MRHQICGVIKNWQTPSEESWYMSYDACEALESGNTDSEGKIRTTMIWGCQWDHALKISLTDKPDFLSNPDDYGVYDGGTSAGKSGTKNGVFNIYDMGGNASEWTIEAFNADNRVSRGYGKDASRYGEAC